MRTCSAGSLAKFLRQITSATLVIFMAFIFNSATAAPSNSNASFKHDVTGFVLNDAHSRVSCESCHTQGVFRGTPRDCGSCHRPGGRAPGKPATHVTTTIACDICHSSSSWTPVHFNHTANQGVVKGQCATCHNNGPAIGKHSAHIHTTVSCDTCHSAQAWLPVNFNHREATPFNCATCHNGRVAVGKSTNHPFTLASCAACHNTSAWVPALKFNHLDIVNNCVRCHIAGTKTTAQQVPKDTLHNNILNVDKCEACHSTRNNFKTGVKFDHKLTATACATCHNGSVDGESGR